MPIQTTNDLSSLSDYSLYGLVKKYVTHELLGFTHSAAKLDRCIAECKKRRKGIFMRASEDAYLEFLAKSDKQSEIFKTISFAYASKEDILNIAPEISNLLPDEADFSKYDIYKVSGDSMINAGIADGEHILAERINEVKDGDIVVVRYMERIFIKRYKLIEGTITLHSENPKFPPFKVYNTENLQILGKVKFKISVVSAE